MDLPDQLPPLHGETLPISIRPEGARKAALLVHGFTGHPGEMGFLARGLSEAGFAVSAPRLPGHGTGEVDFAATGRRDWLRRAWDAYLDLRAAFDTVYVAGHSMGGLIALELASRAPIERVALMAPALSLANPGFKAAAFLAPIVPRWPLGMEPAANASKLERELVAEYRGFMRTRQAGELESLRRAVRRRLWKVDANILLVTGDEDDVVTASCAKILSGGLRGPVRSRLRHEILPGADHLFPFNERRDENLELILGWFGA